jgi:hypothetical protein
MERDHAKEKQKLVKDKDAGSCSQSSCVPFSFTEAGMKAKSQLTKANQTKTKMENLARELQKVIILVLSSLLSLTHFCRTTRNYGFAVLAPLHCWLLTKVIGRQQAFGPIR